MLFNFYFVIVVIGCYQSMYIMNQLKSLVSHVTHNRVSLNLVAISIIDDVDLRVWIKLDISSSLFLCLLMCLMFDLFIIFFVVVVYIDSLNADNTERASNSWNTGIRIVQRHHFDISILPKRAIITCTVINTHTQNDSPRKVWMRRKTPGIVHGQAWIATSV